MTPSSNRASTNLKVGQVSVAATATLVCVARDPRSQIIITNTTTTAVYLGNSDVTTTTGHFLPGIVGATIILPFSGAVYGIVASSTATVTFAETA